MGKKLKNLDPNARSFVANQKTYFIETQLSIDRFHEYQILEKGAGFSTSFKSMVDSLVEIYEDLNTMRAADAAVKIHNLLAGITKVQEKEHTLLKMCALFMNTEDEDRDIITDDMIRTKIEDWRGYDVGGFFTIALNSVSGFFKVYSDMLQIISGNSQKPTTKWA